MLDIALEYANALQNKLGGSTYEFYVDYGKKYDRILQRTVYSSHTSGGSVHAFIERSNGKLIKAATYKAPQKDRDGLAYRYDLSTPEGFQKALDASDPYGSYLYKR